MLFTQQLELRYLCFSVRVSKGNDWFDLGRQTLILMLRKDEISCYLEIALELYLEIYAKASLDYIFTFDFLKGRTTNRCYSYCKKFTACRRISMLKFHGPRASNTNETIFPSNSKRIR